MGTHRRRGSGPGTFLVIVGCLAVLSGTFAVGLIAGRHWPGARTVKSAAEPRSPRGRDRSASVAEPTPTLTFYDELTAPLAAPAPVRPPKPRVEKSEAARPEKPEPRSGPFTVQVGAYRTREPAEALRARLAAAGRAAYVVEAEAPGGVRYRVRVGVFPTREAAQTAAVGIAGREGTPSAFVTTR